MAGVAAATDLELQFRQANGQVSWPASLEELMVRGDFNQPICRVSWRETLKKIDLWFYVQQTSRQGFGAGIAGGAQVWKHLQPADMWGVVAGIRSRVDLWFYVRQTDRQSFVAAIAGEAEV